MTDLKNRVAAALANGNVGSAELFELVSATEAAAKAANAAAADAREQSTKLDADPKLSAQAISVAEIERGQLQRAAQQLRDTLPIALSREAVEKYSVARDRLQPELDALEQEAKQTIHECFDRLVELFGSIAAFKERARRELPDLPPATAPLRSFHPDLLRLLEKTQLFDFAGSQIWPRPSVPFSVAMVQSMQFPSHSRGVGNYVGPGWELPEMQEKFRAEGAREREQQARRYEQMTKESEDRQNRELAEQFAASQQRR